MSELSATPLVSVIVPVYGGERFLAEALDSVAAQSHRAVETIVVDDGSPDASVAVAEAREGVRVLRQSHAGVAAARNAGLAAAQGELVAFIDQDDVWRPRKLERQLELLRACPEVDIALCKMDVVLVEGTPRPAWCPPAWLEHPQPAFLPSAWLVRRRAFDRVGGFDESFISGSDSDWLVRARHAGVGSDMLDEALLGWRVHGANGSYNTAMMRREMFAILRRNVAIHKCERAVRET